VDLVEVRHSVVRHFELVEKLLYFAVVSIFEIGSPGLRNVGFLEPEELVAD
jgi:hypothetical protein